MRPKADVGKMDAGKSDPPKTDAGAKKDGDGDEEVDAAGIDAGGGSGQGSCVAEPANACEECGCTECAAESHRGPDRGPEPGSLRRGSWLGSSNEI